MRAIIIRSVGRGGMSLALMRDRLVAALSCIFVMSACTFVSGCSGGDDADVRPGRRAILIGIDGASPRLMTPLLAEGRLPNLAQLAEKGVYGALRSELPLYSPRVWNSIATGKRPEQHGVEAFVYKEGETRRLYRSDHRRVPALWNILSEAGLRIGVVNWWTTFPPELIDGVMVSDHFFPEQVDKLRQTFGAADDPAGDLVHPPEFLARAEQALTLKRPVSEIESPFEESNPLPPWVRRSGLQRQFDTDADITRVALAIEEGYAPDVMFVFLPGIDRVSHALWGNIEPPELYPPPLRPNATDRAGGVHALHTYYQYTDDLIGKLIEPYGPDDLVMVISDHGFEAGQVLMLLTGQHESEASLDGIAFARGFGVEHGDLGPLSIFDIAPSLLAWLELPTANDMAGRPAGFLADAPTSQVASYDGTPIERMTLGTSAVEEEIVEHLEALGYLEEDEGGEGSE